MTITKTEVEAYLHEVKTAVREDRYEIARNSKRQDNIDLFTDYVIDEADAKDILLSLEVTDFSNITQNYKPGREHEKLYVFGKDVNVLERFGNNLKTVSLYIKFNKLDNSYVIVVSFHEQRYPLSYYFR